MTIPAPTIQHRHLRVTTMLRIPPGLHRFGPERATCPNPKCEATPPTWRIGEGYSHCLRCGADWHTTQGETP